MKTYKCPLCGSTLPKNRYDAVLHIQQEKEKSQQQDLDKLKKTLDRQLKSEASLKKQLKETRKRIKTAETEGVQKGKLVEKRRGERLTAGLRNQLAKAQTRIKQLEKGTTPQTEGLEFESNLYKRLKKEFVADSFEHTGKGGDILHSVLLNRKVVGIIIYECKQCPKIQSSHIRQAALAKKTRQAHFAILVTSGTRSKFTGLDQEAGVLIVAPLGVIPLAHLCRGHLIEMAKAKVKESEKNRIAVKLLEYITSPVHKVPLEQAIVGTQKARDALIKEIKGHFGIWQERHAIYESIKWDITHIQENVSRVLQGEKLLSLQKPVIERLKLPDITKQSV